MRADTRCGARIGFSGSRRCTPCGSSWNPGEVIDDPLAYVALAAICVPLLVDGRTVRCAGAAQPRAMTLTGASADSDGLDVTPVG